MAKYAKYLFHCPKCRENFYAPKPEWQGPTDEEIRNEAKRHVFDESFFNGAVWARGQIKERNNG